MKILLADDDEITRFAVSAALRGWGFEVEICGDGQAAWETLRRPAAPKLALLDWLMPGMDGPAVCRAVRAEPGLESTYLVMLTGRDSKADMIAGLASGADDYIAKPIHYEELRLRVRVGQRILGLQSDLAARVQELEEALARVRQLQGILPICSYCKKIRNDANYWQQVEAYIASQTEVKFSHGICPECYETEIKPQLKKLNRDLPPYPPAG
ncbi:MAG: PleD family two-component system response regulator [Gemmataceae bacterium]